MRVGTGLFLGFVRLLVLGLVVARACPGQDVAEMFYRAIGTEDGLPDNYVTGIEQSQDGYLWVGTEGGLVRLDGTAATDISFQRFPSVRGRSVTTIKLDDQGQLWVGLKRGPTIRLGRFGGRTFGEVDGMYDGAALAIEEDGEGNVWIGYAEGLCRVTGDEGVREDFGDPGGMKEISHMAPEAGGGIWLSDGKKLGLVRAGEIEEVMNFREGKGLACLGRSATAGVWIGAGRDVIKFQHGEGVLTVATLPRGAEAVALFEDRNGVLWIGTANDGLFRLVEGTLKPVPTSVDEIGCLAMDQEGNLLVGTGGGGLNFVRERAIQLIGTADGLPFDQVVSTCEDDRGVLWIVGRGGGIARRIGGMWEETGGGDWQANCVCPDGEGGC